MNIENKIELINENFKTIDLKYKVFDRELINSENIGRKLLIKLNKECSCVQKVYYGKGRNSYRLYAPLGFIDFIKKIELL